MDCAHGSSATTRRSKRENALAWHSILVVFAFPFGIGALEVFYAVFLEVPWSCGDFVDQVVVVGDGVSGAGGDARATADLEIGATGLLNVAANLDDCVIVAPDVSKVKAPTDSEQGMGLGDLFREMPGFGAADAQKQ